MCEVRRVETFWPRAERSCTASMNNMSTHQRRIDMKAQYDANGLLAMPTGTVGNDARVLVYSQRRSNRLIWQTTTYELEDLILSIDRARLLSPAPSEHALSNAVDHLHGYLTGRPWVGSVPYVQPTTVERDYELFFSVFQFPYQLPLLRHLHHWRKRCRKAVCLILELWRPGIERYARYLSVLEQFDHVFIGNRVSVEPLAKRLKVPCSYLPPGIEAQALSPYPNPPERVIDCYSFGRRSPGVHAALLEMAERTRLTYVYDTLDANRVHDYREHRRLVANLCKRSRYCFAFRLNDNAERARKTGGEDGLALRFFEGAAAGTVLLGSKPRCAEHDECFDWPDSTINIAFDGSDVRDVIAALDAQPDRVARIRRSNIVNSLRRHDFLYRWERVLDAACMAHTPGMAQRRDRLEQLAQLALA
jgi:Glycosyl transferases group 1